MPLSGLVYCAIQTSLYIRQRVLRVRCASYHARTSSNDITPRHPNVCHWCRLGLLCHTDLQVDRLLQTSRAVGRFQTCACTRHHAMHHAQQQVRVRVLNVSSPPNVIDLAAKKFNVLLGLSGKQMRAGKHIPWSNQPEVVLKRMCSESYIRRRQAAPSRDRRWTHQTCAALRGGG